MLLTSCGNKKQQVTITLPDTTPSMVFTHEDTVEIQQMVGQFIDRLDNKDIRGAVEMLNFLAEGEKIEPLNTIQKRRQAMSLANVMGVKYEMRHFILRSETNNEVKMEITLFEKPEGDKRPNTTAMYFRPVKYQGKWFLTVWDNITETKSEDRLEK